MSNTKTITRKSTPDGKSYWDETGAFQKEYKKLNKELVPVEGEAETMHGEMIRAIGNLFYDFCNNGNCNAVEAVEEDCPECHGSGYKERSHRHSSNDEDEDVDCSYCGGECKINTGNEVTEYYKNMLDYIKDHLPKEDKHLVNELENFMCTVTYGRHKFDAEEMGYYNRVTDAVMYFVLTTENKPR